MLVGAGFASILKAIFYASQHIILVRHERIKGDIIIIIMARLVSPLPSPLQLSVLLVSATDCSQSTIEMTAVGHGSELCNMSN